MHPSAVVYAAFSISILLEAVFAQLARGNAACMSRYFSSASATQRAAHRRVGDGSGIRKRRGRVNWATKRLEPVARGRKPGFDQPRAHALHASGRNGGRIWREFRLKRKFHVSSALLLSALAAWAAPGEPPSCSRRSLTA